jgi:hypothetical protein
MVGRQWRKLLIIGFIEYLGESKIPVRICGIPAVIEIINLQSFSGPAHFPEVNILECKGFSAVEKIPLIHIEICLVKISLGFDDP